MKTGAALVVACLMQMPACASTSLAGPEPVRTLSMRELLRPAMQYSQSIAEVQTSDKRLQFAASLVYESAFARAIARAAKRSASELALEAATKIIIMCQKERNPALTTPFFRADSQQAHCFRY